MVKAYLKYFSALLLFGLNGVVASSIDLPGTQIALLRTLIGSVFLLAVWGCSGARLHRPDKRHLLYLAVSGAAMGGSWVLLFTAYAQVGVSMATLLYYCGPVLVMALSPLLFGERLTRAKVGGLLVVLAGLVCTGTGAPGRLGAAGLFCGAGAAVLYAVMVLFDKKAASITGLPGTAVQLVAGALTTALFLGAGPPLSLPALAADLVPVLLLGVVHTGLGCYLYFSAVQLLPAASVAICGYVESLSALVFAALFLQERLSARQLLGAVLMLGGAVVGARSGARRTGSRRRV